jgi:bisanhydrobacterioruberin hydratase
MDNNLPRQRISVSTFRTSIGTLALYLVFIGGGLWNSFRGNQSFLRDLTPLLFIACACAAFLLMYRPTMRNMGAALGVMLMAFAAEAAGVNLGFPFGDFVYTNALGPKLLDVPLAIPFLWLVLLVLSWSAADRMLRYKHVVVAAIIATAFDAILEFAADSLDLWHWQGGMPTELNFISWFTISLLGLSLLRRYATEKGTDPMLSHLLIALLLYFSITDVGIYFFSPLVY